jgi:heparosan-N-sulfate-glucuronate 5-epimerase
VVSEKERIRKLRFSIGTKIRESNLQEYYVSFKNWVPYVESGSFGPLDDDGIPLVDYDTYAGMSGIGRVHFPVTVAQYALGLFETWLETGQEKLRDKFLKQVRWLESNAEPVGDVAVVWPARFDFPVYGLKAPWISSMAQSQVASVLLRAWQLEKKDELRNIARKAMACFSVPAGEPGGVRFVDDDGDVWFEEYVTSPPAHVLNGFIFSLFGLLDLSRATSDEAALRLWQQGIATLEQKLELYDTGYWSRYDLLRDCVASEFYHGNVHVPLLRVLHLVSGKSVFMHFADRWEQYLASKVCRLRARYYRLPSRILRRLKSMAGVKQ